MIKKICYKALLLISMLSMVSCGFFSNSMENFFEAWQVTNDSSVAIVDDRAETITFNEKSINIQSILERYY
jgi:hypothetical protein